MARETWALADIGGTNTRLALGDGTTIGPARHFANNDHADFETLFAAWLADLPVRPTRACIALAGPVTGTAATLTNRDWLIDATRLSALIGGGEVKLINDLAALGYAVSTPGFRGARRIDGPDAPRDGQQWLVLGLGTGVNGAAGRRMGDGVVVLDAEIGHAAPPATVERILPGGKSIEALFAGPGLARLAGRATATEAMAAAAGNPAVIDRFAEGLGVLARELAMYFLPKSGFYFAGSVARAVLNSPARVAFLRGWDGGPKGAGAIGPIPLNLIEDDAAALWGCLARLAQRD